MLAVVLLLGVGATSAVAGEGGRPAATALGLTFDDGPDPVWTPIILDLLEDHDAVATFFVLGWKVDAYPEVAADIVIRGHSIQVHGYHHNLFTRMSDAAIRADLGKSIGAIYRATGVRPTCFRAPRGITDDRVANIASEFGLAVVTWDRDTADYAVQTRAGILRRLLASEPGETVLAHDIWGFLWRDSLPPALSEFQSRGYAYDTICDDHGPYQRSRMWSVPIGAR